MCTILRVYVPDTVGLNKKKIFNCPFGFQIEYFITYLLLFKILKQR